MVCAHTDATIFEIAARQHGIVTRSQLVAAGVPVHAIEHRLEKGRIQAVHRAVYRVGPVAAPYEREMAAVLACGRHAVLSHRTAAALYELMPAPRRKALVDVSGPRGLRGPRRGVRLHRVRRLHSDEVGQAHGLPLTTPARTLLDLASCAGSGEVERALAEAERRQLVDHSAIEAVLTRHPRRRGNRRLRALLDMEGGAALTRSEAESRFLALVRKADFPWPRVNAFAEGLEVDFLWEGQRLVVEVDGFAYHGDRAAFERDRRRDGLLMAAGFRVMRVTWRQLTAEPEAVLARLARALALAGREHNPGGKR